MHHGTDAILVSLLQGPATVQAVALEIGTAESVSLISKNHWKSGHPVSLISNLGSPNSFLRRQRRRQRGLPKTESQSSVVQGEGDGHQASEWEGGQRALYQQLRTAARSGGGRGACEARSRKFLRAPPARSQSNF